VNSLLHSIGPFLSATSTETLPMPFPSPQLYSSTATSSSLPPGCLTSTMFPIQPSSQNLVLLLYIVSLTPIITTF